METIAKYITLRNFAAFLIVVFCIRYIPIDTRASVSYFKIAVSLICPFVFVLVTPKINKTFFLILLYAVLVFSTAFLHFKTFRWTTILFLFSYLLMFQTFYNLIYEKKVFTLDFFTRFLEGFILAYFFLLLVQQIALVVGITYLPIINLTQFLDRGIGANSLSGEPSVSARVLTVLFLSLLRMYEIKYGRSLTFLEIYRVAKWPTIGFVWCMLTMGSGTAFIALGIISLYFVKRQHAFWVIPLIVLVYLYVPYVEFEPLQRAYRSFNAFLTLDADIVRSADGSAAARLVPLVNTITSIDITRWETWFGNGVDYSLKEGFFSDIIMIGEIGNYGLLSFLIAQCLVFSCAIRKVFSIETLIWIGLFNMSLTNTPYVWGVVMILTTVKYFQTTKKMDL